MTKYRLPKPQLKPLTQTEVASLVANLCEEYGGKSRAAERWGVSLNMVYLVINGQRSPTANMLFDLGLEAVPPPPPEKVEPLYIKRKRRRG